MLPATAEIHLHLVRGLGGVNVKPCLSYIHIHTHAHTHIYSIYIYIYIYIYIHIYILTHKRSMSHRQDFLQSTLSKVFIKYI